MTEQHAFRAMGTDVELFGEPAGFAAVEAELERLEAILSRFRPDSELSRLNRDGHVEAGTDLLVVSTLALEARELTGGLFDPTVHDALVAAGYDRSFELLQHDRPRTATPVACAGSVTIRGREIRLAPGTHLDLGGIGKGYAVDRAAELLGAHGPALVNAGGDIACRGGSWHVGVELPGDVLTIALERGAIATSGSDRRAWAGGHHLIDPSTGLPARSAYLRVTVAAATATAAEVLAKAIYLGADPGDTPTVLVGRDGSVRRTGELG